MLIAPALAWLVFVSWADGKPSDQAHVAWFTAVAAATVVAGAVARPWAWQLAAPCVVLAAPALLAGRRLAGRRLAGR